MRRASHSPSCYVSYQTADQSELTHTDLVTGSESPSWNHEHDTRLDKALLQQGNKVGGWVEGEGCG